MLERANSAARTRFTMRELRRLGLWGLAATAALVVAAFVATSESGERRLVQSWAELHAFGSARLSSRANDDTRRLTDTIRSLTADRAALTARLEVLERNLGEI